MHVALACDHGGFEQKQIFLDWIEQELKIECLDCGCYSEDSVDYPDFAKKACSRVQSGQCDFAILICGTGIGMAIAANKIKGMRAANCTMVDFARLSREHNNANVLTLSGRFVDLETNKLIIKTFLETSFAGDRHERRVQKIMDLQDD